MRELFFKYTQKTLRTDPKYLLRNGFWTALSRTISSVSGITLAIVFANYVSPQVYGNYKYIIAVAAIIGAFTLTEVGTAITRSVARGYEGVLITGAKKTLGWGSTLFIISSIIGAYYYFNDNLTLGTSFLIIGITSPIILSCNTYRNFLTGKKEFKKLTQYFLIRRTVTVCTLAAAIILSNDIIVIIAASFISEALMSVFFYVRTVKIFKPNSQIEELDYLSKHLSIMNIFKTIAGNLDKILAFQFLGAGQLAIYAFARTPINEIGSFNTMLANLAYPKLSERSFDEIKKTLPRKMFILMFVMGFVSLTYCLIAEHFFSTLFSEYIDSVAYSQIMSLMLVFAPGLLLTKALTAHKRVRSLYIIRITQPFLTVICFGILTPLYSVWGLVSAGILVQIIKFFLALILFYREPTSKN